MKLTYYGHACFTLETQGKTIIFDPFISPNELAKDVDVASLRADYILLTHGHGDHIADVETIAKNSESTIVSGYEVASHYGNRGFNHHPMNHGGKVKFDFGTAKYVNAIHSSSFPDGAYAGNPGGFVVWNEEACIYHAGDTALTMDMQLIPMTCPALDVAILPIGDNFTMGYEDAVVAADLIKCDKVVACHYDTFGYIKIDHEAAKKAFADSGKALILLGIGESLTI